MWDSYIISDYCALGGNFPLKISIRSHLIALLGGCRILEVSYLRRSRSTICIGNQSVEWVCAVFRRCRFERFTCAVKPLLNITA